MGVFGPPRPHPPSGRLVMTREFIGSVAVHWTVRAWGAPMCSRSAVHFRLWPLPSTLLHQYGSWPGLLGLSSTWVVAPSYPAKDWRGLKSLFICCNFSNSPISLHWLLTDQGNLEVKNLTCEKIYINFVQNLSHHFKIRPASSIFF